MMRSMGAGAAISVAKCESGGAGSQFAETWLILFALCRVTGPRCPGMKVLKNSVSLKYLTVFGRVAEAVGGQKLARHLLNANRFRLPDGYGTQNGKAFGKDRPDSH